MLAECLRQNTASGTSEKTAPSATTRKTELVEKAGIVLQARNIVTLLPRLAHPYTIAARRERLGVTENPSVDA
jgi:hypothetical protein